MGILTGNKQYRDVGLLIIRLGIGASLAFLHGYGKISSGPDLWERLGGAMQNFGISFVPVFWGFMASVAEFFGSLLIMLGVLFRPAALLLMATMVVAATRHLSLPPDAERAGLQGASHALELLAVYIGLFLTGPGQYTLARLWSRK